MPIDRDDRVVRRGEIGGEAAVETDLQRHACVSAAAIARSASSRVSAIGFSQNTCLPACAAATTRSVWVAAGELMATAWTVGSSISSNGSAYARGAPIDLCRFDIRIGDGHQGGAGQPVRQRLGVEAADPSGSDEAEAKLVRHVALRRTRTF